MEESILNILFSRLKPINSRILFLVPALNIDNAIKVNQALNGAGLVAVSANKYSSAESLAQEAKQMQDKLGVISIALGEADFSQAEKVIKAALLSKPDHINQPFELSGYAQGRLHQAGVKHTIINALVQEANREDQVIIKIGKKNAERIITLQIRDAMELISGWGIKSVKAQFTKKGVNFNWLANITRAAKEAGLELVEPSSGITEENINEVINTGLKCGCAFILPHVFSSLIDKSTGLTKPEAVSRMVELVRQRFI
ncbi:MAG TPA: KDGP aldolase family protein [Anaerolineae bacterium]|nr:KDGP aldolase family protein [Anaerolineae bacterium]